jgi:CBS-domain-containing membrane protein
MQLTETTHPPGGATALLAVTTEPLLPWSNFLFILMPALSGACVMLLVALIINNMAPKRTYPCFWW